MTLNTSKNRTAAAYYNAEKDFVALYDTRYISALCPGFTLRAAGTTSAAIAYNGKEPFALVLPIRPDDKTTRAVKAYFTQAAEAETNEAEQLRAELARLQDKLARSEAGSAALQDRVQQQANEVEHLNAKISTLEDELSTVGHENAVLHERVAQPGHGDHRRPQRRPGRRRPQDRRRNHRGPLHRLDGVTATIKGAHTAAPVVWLSGDTDKHADEIKAAGAKWSGKRSAYYVRVALTQPARPTASAAAGASPAAPPGAGAHGSHPTTQNRRFSQ